MKSYTIPILIFLIIATTGNCLASASTTMNISALSPTNTPFTDTGIVVKQGVNVSITADPSKQWTTGIAYCGPSGDFANTQLAMNSGWMWIPYPTALFGELIAYVGDNPTGGKTHYWAIGNGTTFTPDLTGHLWLGINDDNGTGAISDNAGNMTVTIKSTTTPPISDFTSNVTSGKAPLNVSFTDKSSGTPTKWKWTFGDGTNSTIKNPIHKYSTAGNYTVTLTVSNAAGSNTTTKTNYIKVIPAVKPVASFTSSVTSGYAPLSVTFTDTSTGIPTSWKWTFGDGTNSTVKNPTHTYSKAGNYTVALTSTNAAGSNTTTKTNYIKVKTAPSTPVAAFSATPVSGTAPLTVSFTDSSIGTPTKWKWNFGDLKTSDVQNPSHVYKKAGTYTVSLTVKNANGTNTTTKTNFITVTNTPLVASFSATPTSGTAPLNVSFTDTSKGTPTKWKWDFGDLKTSKVQNPSHVYKKAGKYTVSLTVKNANGINTTTKASFVVVANK